MLKSDLKGLSRVWKAEKRHTGVYNGGKVQLSGNGEFVACLFGGNINFLDFAKGDVQRRLWDLQEGEEDSCQEEVVCFCLNPRSKTGNELVTASRPLLLRAWQWDPAAAKYTLVRSLKGHTLPVLTMDYDSTGTLVATGSADRTVKVWDMDKGFATHNFKGHTSIVTAVAFHPDPNRMLLVSGSEDSTVRIWDLLAKNSCVAEFKDHLSVVTSLCFVGGYTLLTGSRDKVVNFWDLRKNRLMHTLPVFEEVEALQIIPAHSTTKKNKSAFANGTFALAGAKGSVRVWKFEEKEDATLFCEVVATQPTSSLNIPQPIGYLGLLFSASSRTLVAITSEHNFICLDSLSLKQKRQLIGYNDEILDIAYVPESMKSEVPAGGGTVAVATNSSQVRLFSLNNFSCKTLDGHADIVLAVSVSPDGLLLASASKDQTCRLWQLFQDEMEETGGSTEGGGKCVMLCKGHTAAVADIALSQKFGPYAAGTAFMISVSGDKTMKRWSLKDLSTKKAQGLTSPLQPKAMFSVLAHEKDINCVAISPNDALVATASQDKTAKLWSSDKLTLLGTLKGHKRGVWKVAFSPADRTVATGSGDRTIKIWSVTDFSCLKTLQGHTASVLSLAFVRSGMQILSAGADGLMKLWTIKTSECDGTFDEHSDRIWALAVHPSGENQAITGGSDSVLTVWKDVSEHEEALNMAQREAALLKEQELLTHMRTHDYAKAVALALELEHPMRLWKIFKEVLDNASLQGSSHNLNFPLDEFIVGMETEKVEKCFRYIREWNTNSRYSTVAQALLNSFFRLYPIDSLRRLPNAKELVAGIIPYTERHFQRIDRLVQASYLITYVMSSMRLLSEPLDIQATADNKDDLGHLPLKVGISSPSSHTVYEVVATDSVSSSSDEFSEAEKYESSFFEEATTQPNRDTSTDKKLKDTKQSQKQKKRLKNAQLLSETSNSELKIKEKSNKKRKHKKEANLSELLDPVLSKKGKKLVPLL